MMMEFDNNNNHEQQQCIVKCEEEEGQNGGWMNDGGDEKKKTKQRISDEEEDIDGDDGVDYEGDEFDDCGKKDADWNSSVGGDLARGGKEKKRKNNNDSNEQNEKNGLNCDDGRARIASRSEIAPAGIPDDDDEEEEMNDGGGGMSDLISSSNNNNHLILNLNGMEGCKRANVRIVFSDITNINNNMEGGGRSLSEMSKRRSGNDNENNDTLSSSSSILFGIGKRRRIESEEGHGSAFRRVSTLEKHGLNDGRWNECDSENRFDFGSDVVAVEKEKTDDLESDGMMIVGDVVANNNNEVEMGDVDREEDGFEFRVKSEKDGYQIESTSPPINMQQEDEESDYDECVWSSSDGDDNNNIADGNSSDASYHPSLIEANRRQARPSQHRTKNGAKACKRRGSVVRSDMGDQEGEENDEIVNNAASTSGLSRRPPGYWNDFSNVERELRAFIERMRDKIKPGRMPTERQLLNGGYSGLRNAIQKRGGFLAVGERLGLAAPAPTKPSGYWNHFSNVVKELRSFIERMGDRIDAGFMPTSSQLEDEGCSDLFSAIMLHGGFAAVAHRLGLRPLPFPTKPQDDFCNVEKKLRSFIERMGDKIEAGRMPTKTQLLDQGCNWLSVAIEKHGGMGVVVERLDLASAPAKPRGYWNDFSNVEKELRVLIERMGDKIEPGRMPTYRQLLDGGCSRLRNAIRKRGGLGVVGERLGLAVLPPTTPPGYWNDFSNVEKELRSFIERMGDKIEPGRMPTVSRLEDEGLNILKSAIMIHGGFEAVGARLNLASSLSTIAKSSIADESGSIAQVKQRESHHPPQISGNLNSIRVDESKTGNNSSDVISTMSAMGQNVSG